MSIYNVINQKRLEMKNIIKLGVIAIVFAVFSFTSCSKDEKDEFSLVGKTYAAFSYHSNAYKGTYLQSDGYDVYKVYRFISDKEVESSSRKNSPTGGIIGDIDKYPYTLNYPTIKIELGTFTAEGTFLDENTFRVTWANGDINEFIKQN